MGVGARPGEAPGRTVALLAMYELPASVRLALWLTHAFHSGLSIEDAIVRALPDVDDVDGDVDRFGVWQDFGERVVCVDLPRPGVHGGLLPAADVATLAAQEAGECLFVPSLGGVVVPRLAHYGPEGDEGLRLTFESFDSDPVPAHRLAALSLPDIDRRFREAMILHVDDLEALHITPFAGSGGRARADRRLDEVQWALPEGLPARALRIITTAGLVIATLDAAQGADDGALAAHRVSAKETALRSLLHEAELAVAEASTVAALALAGLHG